MRNLFKPSFWAYALGLLLLISTIAVAQTKPLQPRISSPTATSLNTQTVLQSLAKVNVVYLGETHDRAADHQAQLDIIQALHQQNPRLTIAMEMFQHPYQPAIDRYLKGEISESDLQTQTEFDTRWGYPWEFYAPILRFAKANRLPVVALNVPSEITRKVARGGLQSLSETDRQLIPPLSEIRPEPDRYRQRLQEIFTAMHHGKGSSRGFDSFFQAQLVWDETMAERISRSLTAQPETQVIVLAGQGHLIYGDGIPSRVMRRQPKLAQSIVLLNAPQELKADRNPAAADYFWSTEN